MARYKLGNVLRGYLHINAKDDREAWDSGRIAFNTAVPTDSQAGRQIELYVEKPVPVTESYARLIKPRATNWHPVLVGMSHDPYPESLEITTQTEKT